MTDIESLIASYSTDNLQSNELKDLFKSAIKEVNSENQELKEKLDNKRVAKLSKEAFEERKKYDALVDKLNKKKLNSKNKSLDIYRVYKDIRSYIYIISTNLKNHAKYLIAKPMLDDVFEAMKYLSLYVNVSLESEKRIYGEKFLAIHDNLADKIEFCIEIRAISFKQASHILSLLFSLEPQIQEFRNLLQINQETRI